MAPFAVSLLRCAKKALCFVNFAYSYVNLGYFGKQGIIHPNLIFRNSKKIAQTQGFFEDTSEHVQPMRDVRNCAIKTPKYLEKMTLQLRDHANCREHEKTP